MKLDGVEIFHGDCLTVLKGLPDCSVDAVVTDPPYGLSNTDPAHVAEALKRWGAGERDYIPEGRGFMGKAWDAFVPPPAVWDECLRVLKPGGHLLAFAGSRTFDLMALSIRLAGFEIRDSIAWLYGSGFPKSLDVSKAIDKAAGAEREVITETVSDIFGERAKETVVIRTGKEAGTYGAMTGISPQTAPATAEAQKWQGWGTALKPAFEPVVVARKPLIGTVAENVLEWGTGGLNIDGTRIGTTVETWPASRSYAPGEMQPGHKGVTEPTGPAPAGRWPSNVMLDEYTAELLDEQSGVSVSKANNRGLQVSGQAGGLAGSQPNWVEGSDSIRGHNDSGGASRFFYVAKASKRDRNEGLDELEATTAGDMVDREEGSAGMNSPRAGAGRTSGAKNFHPTVKPTDLMRQLVRLVTPPGGTVLDPFTGSGSTGKAAILEGFQFVGIELTKEYLPIIEGRLRHAIKVKAEMDAKDSEALF